MAALTLRNILLVVLIGGIGLVVFWWQEDPDAQETGPETRVEIKQPDLFGRDVNFNQFHADGTLHYRLQAAVIRQFEADRLTRLETPHLHLRSTDQPPWDIYAESGFIRTQANDKGVDEEVVYLSENVRMLQEHPENGLLTLRSSSFYLYPDRQYAHTEQGVIIDSQVGRTTAAGMVADLNTGVLSLTSGPRPRTPPGATTVEDVDAEPDVAAGELNRPTIQRVKTIVLPDQFKS